MPHLGTIHYLKNTAKTTNSSEAKPTNGDPNTSYVKMTQYFRDHLLWVRQVRRLTSSMTQIHPICGCPTPIVTMVLKSQFLPRMQIKHLRRQRQHIQDRVRLGSSVRFLLQGHCECWGVSIADYTFAEMTNVSGLGISYSLENLTNLRHGLMIHFPVPFCGRSSYSSGRSSGCWRPSSPSTLEIKSMKS